MSQVKDITDSVESDKCVTFSPYRYAEAYKKINTPHLFDFGPLAYGLALGCGYGIINESDLDYTRLIRQRLDYYIEDSNFISPYHTTGEMNLLGKEEEKMLYALSNFPQNDIAQIDRPSLAKAVGQYLGTGGLHLLRDVDSDIQHIIINVIEASERAYGHFLDDLERRTVLLESGRFDKLRLVSDPSPYYRVPLPYPIYIDYEGLKFHYIIKLPHPNDELNSRRIKLLDQVFQLYSSGYGFVVELLSNMRTPVNRDGIHDEEYDEMRRLFEDLYDTRRRRYHLAPPRKSRAR